MHHRSSGGRDRAGDPRGRTANEVTALDTASLATHLPRILRRELEQHGSEEEAAASDLDLLGGMLGVAVEEVKDAALALEVEVTADSFAGATSDTEGKSRASALEGLQEATDHAFAVYGLAHRALGAR
jgi:hypothetical protein